MEVRGLALVLVVAVSTGSAALPFAPSPSSAAVDPGDAHVTDPAGDAYEWSTAWLRDVALQCNAAGAASRAACESAPATPEQGATPAPPDRDVLAAWFEETPQDLVVTLELARLDALAMGALRNEGWIVYGVCWTSLGQECALVDGRYDRGEGAHLEAAFRRGGEDDVLCGAAGCSWAVAAELRTGAPGALVWHIPRDLLQAGEAGTSLREPFAYVTHTRSVATQGARWQVAGVGPAAAGSYDSRVGYASDTTAPGRGFELLAPHVPAAVLPAGERRDDAGDVVGEPREDVDILFARISDTPRHLVVSVELARVDEDPRPHVIEGWIAFETFAVGYEVVAWDGVRKAEARSCLQTGEGRECTRFLDLPAEVELVPGAPGWVNVSFPRDALGHPKARLRSLMALVDVWSVEAVERADDPLLVRTEHRTANDWSAYLAPYALRHDTLGEPPALDRSGLVVEDDLDDVDLPVLLDPSEAARFDIVAIAAEGLSPGTTRFELVVQDLSRVTVPLGYDAVFYAVGVETERGRFMIGYHRTSAEQGNRQSFLCAPDTTVLAEERSDPAEVVWQTIEGVLTVARAGSRGAAGSGQAGAILFTVPHSCFGEEGEGLVPASRLAGGVYLVRTLPLGARTEVTMLDEARHEGDFTLGALAIPAPAPWYVRPFGVENFWDMLGIGLAVAVTGVGAGLVQRKRGALKRYLREVERANETKDAKARGDALVRIRDRLKRDLLGNRISEGHYVIVERRLDEVLSSARMDALGESFGDLPFRLVRRLQALLADGRMSREDFALFRTQLQAEGQLTVEAKRDILGRVEAWVREDAPEATP